MGKFEYIGKYISFLYRYHQIYLDRELEPYQISSGQFFILMPLFEKDGINQESISQIIKMDKATVTRAVQKLIIEGYVIRERDEEDRRAYRVFLTQKGKAIKTDIIGIARRWDDILLTHLDSKQRDVAASAFDMMIRDVSEYMKR